MKPRSYWKKLSDQERIRGKRGLETQKNNRLISGVDADTLRYRSLESRRGLFLASFSFIRDESKEVWEIRYSTCGRQDQFDIFRDQVKIKICGAGKLGKMVSDTLKGKDIKSN